MINRMSDTSGNVWKWLASFLGWGSCAAVFGAVMQWWPEGVAALYGLWPADWMIKYLAAIPSIWPATAAGAGTLAATCFIKYRHASARERKGRISRENLAEIGKLRKEEVQFHTDSLISWNGRRDTDFILLRDKIRSYIAENFSEAEASHFITVGPIVPMHITDDHSRVLWIMTRDSEFLGAMIRDGMNALRESERGA